MAVEYENMSLAQLKEAAKEMGLKKTTQLRKKELIELLKNSGGKSTASSKLADGKAASGIENGPEQAVKAIPTGAEGGEVVKPKRGRPRKKPYEESIQAVKAEQNTAKSKTEKEALKLPGEVADKIAEAKPADTKVTEAKPAQANGSEERTAEGKAAERSVDRPQEERSARVEGRSDYQTRKNEYTHNREYRPGYRSDYNRTDYNRSENNRQEYGHSENNRTDYNRSDYNRTDYNRSDYNRTDYNRTDYNRSDYNRSENTRQEYVRTDYVRPDSPRPESQPDYKRPDNRFAENKGSVPTDMAELDSGETKEGILEIMADGYGFIRCDNYLPGDNDVYVSPAQIRRFNLKTGDIIIGNTRIRSQNEKFSALLYVKSVNGFHPSEAQKRKKFEDLTPVFPKERIYMETPDCSITMRMIDIFAPIGKGQRGMIVSQPKAGKTTILKQIAGSITKNYPDMNLIILLIDERPEEVTDIKESIEGENVEVIYSTFDELPENHKRVSEMVIERAKRLVEHKKDVVILLDSITRLARAYNLTIQPSGRTLSGGLDPAALYMPKRFFGAARNMREGGSLTVLATALVDTGSRMDDVVFEEFKGTGNMEIVLDRNLSEKRIFPAIDLSKSSTRRDDLLLEPVYFESANVMRRWLSGQRPEEALEHIINIFTKTKTNTEFVKMLIKSKMPEKLI